MKRKYTNRQIEETALELLACQEFIGSLTGTELVTAHLLCQGLTIMQIAKYREISRAAVYVTINQLQDKAKEIFGKEAVEGRLRPPIKRKAMLIPFLQAQA